MKQEVHKQSWNERWRGDEKNLREGVGRREEKAIERRKKGQGGKKKGRER